MRIFSLLLFVVLLASGCVGSTGYIVADFSETLDGDTLELSDGTRVRLLGIETPEKGQMFYREAHARLNQLIEGKQLKLERDKQDKDRYGRALRHVFIDDMHVNKILVQEGLARVRVIEPNVKYSDKLRSAESRARDANLNIWSVDSPSNCLGFSIISGGHPEYLRIKNSCDYDIDMTGWTIKGDYNLVYTFPQFIVHGNFASFNLNSRNGTTNETDLFWGIGNAWNKNRDTITLRDENGMTVLIHSYPDLI